MMVNKALFLDRDGVINIDYGYVHKVEDFDFVSGIFDLAREAESKGYMIFVITNQAGIGRGYFSENEFKHVTDWMLSKFFSEGIAVSKVYYCPYHPTHGKGTYKQDHELRKPNPGMINLAAKEFHINVSESILIGDNLTDIEAGQNAGVGTNILYIESDRVKPVMSSADYIVSSMYDAKLLISLKND